MLTVVLVLAANGGSDEKGGIDILVAGFMQTNVIKSIVESTLIL
jgi:hypothetical protein